jgi:hypothetical protein
VSADAVPRSSSRYLVRVSADIATLTLTDTVPRCAGHPVCSSRRGPPHWQVRVTVLYARAGTLPALLGKPEWGHVRVRDGCRGPQRLMSLGRFGGVGNTGGGQAPALPCRLPDRPSIPLRVRARESSLRAFLCNAALPRRDPPPVSESPSNSPRQGLSHRTPFPPSHFNLARTLSRKPGSGRLRGNVEATAIPAPPCKSEHRERGRAVQRDASLHCLLAANKSFCKAGDNACE